ncbi:hypothetical protein TorRG33x02_311380, partial [Trema orientale]
TFPWLAISVSSVLSFGSSERNPKEQPPPLFPAMPSISCDLPEEVLEEILSWVPPESLIRFKCVTKSWYAHINSLLKNPEFVNKHLHNLNNKISSSSTLIFSSVSIAHRQHPEMESLRHSLFKSVTVFHDHHNERNGGNFVREDFRLPTLPSEVNLSGAVRSHCNGIICLAHDETIILCNPAIREWRILPKPCVSYGEFCVKPVGFSYDSRGNDYKVVRLGTDSFRRDGIKRFKMRAEVYSMSSDSWKETGIQLEFDRLPHLGKEVFCKGVFYWFIFSGRNIILSFDLFDEVFHTIRLPNNLVEATKDHSIESAVWNESIALFVYRQENAITESIEVWVTDDCSGGVNDSCSWIKKLTIRPPVDVAYPLAFLKNDEVLMKATSRTFVLYNLRSQMIRNLSFMDVPMSCVDWDYSYVKSLISVHGGSQTH